MTPVDGLQLLNTGFSPYPKTIVYVVKNVGTFSSQPLLLSSSRESTVCAWRLSDCRKHATSEMSGTQKPLATVSSAHKGWIFTLSADETGEHRTDLVQKVKM